MKDEYKSLQINKLQWLNKWDLTDKRLSRNWDHYNLLYQSKLDWTRARVFVKIPPLFQVLLFKCILPCSEPLAILAASAGLPAWADLAAMLLPGFFGLCEMESSRRRLAGRFAVARPFESRGRRLREAEFWSFSNKARQIEADCGSQ